MSGGRDQGSRADEGVRPTFVPMASSTLVSRFFRSQDFEGQMFPMVVRGCGLERKSENPASFQRIDNGVHVAAGRGKARVQPAFVVGARFLNAFVQVIRNRLL